MAKRASPKKGIYRLKKCPCLVTDTTFAKMCDPCQKEHDEIKERWTADYAALKKNKGF